MLDDKKGTGDKKASRDEDEEDMHRAAQGEGHAHGPHAPLTLVIVLGKRMAPAQRKTVAARR